MAARIFAVDVFATVRRDSSGIVIRIARPLKGAYLEGSEGLRLDVGSPKRRSSLVNCMLVLAILIRRNSERP